MLDLEPHCPRRPLGPADRWGDRIGVRRTAIVLVSIALGQPFTRQYAREEVPPELWESPIFPKSTAVIAWVWLGALVGWR
jgi:hypothetical protein